jgi:NAD dependent epimerase/dehydratase
MMRPLRLGQQAGAPGRGTGTDTGVTIVNWNAKKVLVTGAGGFIGSHLCERLVEAGAEVHALIRYTSRSDWGNLELLPDDRRGALRVVAGNVEDGDFVARQVKGKDVVFHLAALIAIPYSYHAPRSYVRTNVEGTLNVLEAARTHGVERVVHTSTSEVYGTAQYAPIDEKHPLQGQSPYSASKIGADKLVESYHLAFDLPVATIRPFNTYGPRQSARAVIPTIVTQALTAPEIRLGALDPVRDLTFVKDTVDGFLAMASSPGAIGQAVNVGSGQGITIGDLARVILELLGVQKPVVLDSERMRPPGSEVFKLICDAGKARALLGWQPRYELREGLREVIDFVSSHLALYRPGHYAI